MTARAADHTRVGRWAFATLLCTVLLIGVGGFTRGSGSGYGCQDRWPLCEGGHLGGVLPRIEQEMMIEWSHRWLAAIVGLLALVTAVSAWRNARGSRAVVVPATAAVVVIGIQAWVGRLIVTNDLDADLVSLHLAISLTVAALLAITATVCLVANPPDAAAARPRRLVLVGSGAALVATVIVLGSIVHNRYYPGWPLMDGALVPDPADTYRFVHFVHRGLAGVGIVVLGCIVVDAYRSAVPPIERRLSVLAAGCYSVNVVLGLAHVVTRVERAEVVALHLVCAAGAWVALVAALVAASRRRGEGSAPAEHVHDAHRADPDHVGQPEAGVGLLS